MKKRKIIVPIILILFIGSSVIGCDLLGLGNRLAGTWRWESGIYWEEITFKKDDTFTVTGDSSLGSYTLTGTYTNTLTTITLDYASGNEFTMDYEISGDTLELTSGGTTWIYIKQ